MNYSWKEIKKKKERLTEETTTVKLRVRKYRGYINAILGIALIFVCIIGVVNFVYQLVSDTPKIQEEDLVSEGNASIMYDIAGKEIQTLDIYDIDSEYATISEIPECVQNAFIAMTDRYFYQHHGINMTGVIEELYAEFIGNASDTQPTSTITLQLIENQVLDAEIDGTLWEKISGIIKEQILAIDLENTISKEQILEYYLNTINLGDEVIGVQSASRKYFDKDIEDVTISEATVLAAVASDAQQYDPVSQQENNSSQRSQVLKIMLEEKMISEDEYEDALGDDVYVRLKNISTAKINRTDNFQSYYTEAVADQVISDLKEQKGYTQTQAYNALYRGELRIYTCQDSTLQEICDTVINTDAYYPSGSKSYLTYSLIIEKDGVTQEYSELDVKNYIYSSRNKSISLYFKKIQKARQYVSAFKKYILKQGGTVISEDIQLVKQPQVSFVLMEQSTGRVQAIVGGRGQRLSNRAINRATEDTRQPGTAFGLLSAYLPALDTAGQTLGTMLDGGNNEKISMREAILSSDSLFATDTLEQISAQTGYEYLQKLGFSTIVEEAKNEDGRTESDIQPQMASGELFEGVTNLELTAAYAAVANNGVYRQARFYTKIVDAQGNVVLENETKSTRVMKESTAWLLTDVMQDFVELEETKEVQFSDLEVEQAGMKGITGDSTDFWFEGYTPYYTAGIWTGQDEDASVEDTGYYLAIWKEIMEQVHRQKQLNIGEFSQSEEIVSCVICSECGKLALEGVCDDVQGTDCTRREYYAYGSQPVENCDCHIQYKICSESGKLAGEDCPEEEVYEKVFRVTDTDSAEEIPQEYCDIHTVKK